MKRVLVEHLENSERQALWRKIAVPVIATTSLFLTMDLYRFPYKERQYGYFGFK